MKKICFLVMTASLALGGGAGNMAPIQKSSTSIGSEVFQLMQDGGPAPKAAADLLVRSSVKTHPPGSHWVADSHGTTEFRLILNVDGQALVLRGMPQEETTQQNRPADAEAGVGTRYEFGAKLRLAPGSHHILAASPEDEVTTERKVTLAEGGRHTLVLEPVYAAVTQRISPYTARNFRHGIVGMRLILDGKEI